MRITHSVPSSITGLSGQELTRPLPPLPICGNNELFTSSNRSKQKERLRTLPPLLVGEDNKYSVYALSAELTSPLTPLPVYDGRPANLRCLMGRTRELPPLPIGEKDRHVESSALSAETASTQPLPPLPTSAGAPMLLSRPSTTSARALPLPPYSNFTRPMRSLPPTPDAGSEIKSPGQLMIV